jgi:hypothetical protein
MLLVGEDDLTMFLVVAGIAVHVGEADVARCVRHDAPCLSSSNLRFMVLCLNKAASLMESNSPSGDETCRAVVDKTAVIQPINRRYSADKWFRTR